MLEWNYMSGSFSGMTTSILFDYHFIIIVAIFNIIVWNKRKGLEDNNYIGDIILEFFKFSCKNRIIRNQKKKPLAII